MVTISICPPPELNFRPDAPYHRRRPSRHEPPSRMCWMPQEEYAYDYNDQTRKEQHKAEWDRESRVSIQADAPAEETYSRRELVGARGEVGERWDALRGGNALLEVLHNAHGGFTACGKAARWRWAYAGRRGACAGVAVDRGEKDEIEDGDSRSPCVVGS